MTEKTEGAIWEFHSLPMIARSGGTAIEIVDCVKDRSDRIHPCSEPYAVKVTANGDKLFYSGVSTVQIGQSLGVRVAKLFQEITLDNLNGGQGPA